MTFWDLIQPAFMFMVGLAMPFAFAVRRLREGQGAVWKHVAYRSFMLIVLSNLLISISAGKLRFQLINVLAQIALAYFICYWLMKLSVKTQAVCAGLILAGYTALFMAWPGARGPYSMGDNIGERVDQFVFGASNPGHWATINFIPSIVVTLAGVWCGYLMMTDWTHRKRMQWLAVGGVASLAVGHGMGLFLPIIKRIHTTSYTIAACGWVVLILLALYWMVEVRGWKRVTWPLVVVGMNSMFIYCLHMVLTGWTDRAVGVFTLKYAVLGKWGPVAQACTVFLPMWYLCYWLYKRRIYVKI
ncbi:MAG: hypothetical protein FJW20_11770 [Acidimicrobiia bacterium]|nr:hypothetical protein [Acidimicrobiia bacterium]